MVCSTGFALHPAGSHGVGLPLAGIGDSAICHGTVVTALFDVPV
jgi:hypothetical protein